MPAVKQMTSPLNIGRFLSTDAAVTMAPSVAFSLGALSPGDFVGTPSSISRKSSFLANDTMMDALAACQETQFAVKDIYISELLPRTADLMYLNVTTIEEQAYCIELTRKGWRVTSLRHDNMNGDLEHLELHTRYFETIHCLMDNVSPSYRVEFGGALVERLKLLQHEQQQQQQATHSTCSGAPGGMVSPPNKLSSSSSCHACGATLPSGSGSRSLSRTSTQNEFMVDGIDS